MSVINPGEEAVVTLKTEIADFKMNSSYPAVYQGSGKWSVSNPNSGMVITLGNDVINTFVRVTPTGPTIEPNDPASRLQRFKEDLKDQPNKKPRSSKVMSKLLQGIPIAAEQQQKQEETASTESLWYVAGRAKLKSGFEGGQKLEVYQCWLSDLTNGRLPASAVDHIITCYPPDHFPEHIRQDIPVFDIYHEWDPDVLENIHMSHTLNIKNLLVGHPGSGKTTSTQQYAALIGQPFMKINGKSGIDGSAFIGFLIAGANGIQFSEGLLPVAMRNGYLLTIDEVFKIPAEIQMNFQTVYEEGGTLLLDEKPGLLCDKLVHPHVDFRLMSTDNARGVGDNFEKFGATQVQDTSTLDRFGLTVFVPYLKPELESKVLKRMFPEVKEGSLLDLCRFANLVREAYNQSNLSLTLSMRGLKAAARLLIMGLSEASAIRSVYMNKLAEDAEINTADGFITTVGLSAKPGEALEPKPEPVNTKAAEKQEDGSFKMVANGFTHTSAPITVPWA